MSNHNEKQIEAEAKMLAEKFSMPWPPLSAEEHETLRGLARMSLHERVEKIKQAADDARERLARTGDLAPKRQQIIGAIAAHAELPEPKPEVVKVNGEHRAVAMPRIRIPKGSPGGARISLPDGIAPTVAVIRAMKLHPDNKLKAAAAIGVHRHTYALISKLITLREGFRISKEDRELVEQALQSIDRDHQISKKTRAIAVPLIKRNWVYRKEPGSERRTLRFDTTVMNISESCAATAEMVIPDLDKTAVLAAVVSLSNSIEQMAKLIRRIMGEKEDT